MTLYQGPAVILLQELHDFPKATHLEDWDQSQFCRLQGVLHCTTWHPCPEALSCQSSALASLGTLRLQFSEPLQTNTDRG